MTPTIISLTIIDMLLAIPIYALIGPARAFVALLTPFLLTARLVGRVG